MPSPASRAEEAKQSLRQRVVLSLRRRLLGAENKRFRDAAALVLDRPETVYLRDESAFLLGIINLMVTEAVVLTNPQGFWLWFLLWLPTLLLIRLWTYSRKGWQMFLLDFCYAANLLMVTALLTGSPVVFWAAFAVACGPVATAIVAWRNSLVFHDIDKTTTVVIHAFPALVAFCTRWFGLGPNGVPFCDSAWGPRVELMRRVWPKSAWEAAVADPGTPCEPIPSALELWVLGMVTYAVWQALYLLLTEVPWLLGSWLEGHDEVETSMRWLVRSKTGLLHRAARAVCEAVGFLGKEEALNSREVKTKFIFVSAQLIFTGITLLPGVMAAHWFEGCTTWLLLLLVGAAANGAQYYVQVFARRYAKSVEEKWAQTVEKAAQIAAEAAAESQVHDAHPRAEVTAVS
ncbi:hypothetical protein FNF27_07234 [Cafeteria roenbergensis]|uniref:Glycerophosphocholine acyltransferase 1 n=1 Tax=Cafeteria roenbergensis TaxID=33653 RepID=A0A5A8DTM8_CAFRO|nr:hypothetical protein FNF27_07234 [Cafeteria roenbergensis]